MKRIIYTVSIILLNALCMQAQENDFSIGGDFVSSYVWRGGYVVGTSIQPAMSMNVKGFSLAAWGNIDLYGGESKEIDFTASYAINGLSFAVTDYWWEGEGVYKYFTYNNKETAHHFEGTVGYTLPSKQFPLSMKWNTMFAGADATDNCCKRLYSTYIEASYPFAVKNVNLEAAAGLSPWKSIYSSGFSVVVMSLKASKSVKITDDFQLPVFGQLIVNPTKEDIFFVFGVNI